MSSIESPVLIVGAGPAGLILALDLLKNGTKVRIIEKTEVLFIGQRGAGIMPRSIELFRALGVLEDIEKIAMYMPRIKRCEAGHGDSKVLETSDMCAWTEPTPSCPYFNPLCLGQGRVQAIIASHLERYGCYVENQTELLNFEQHDDHVVYRLKKTGADGVVTEEESQASYLVGADGTRGIVRKQLGLSFLGETRETERFVIADVHLTGIKIDHSFWHMWGEFDTGLLTIRPTDRCDEGEFWIAIIGHHIDAEFLSNNPVEFANLVRKISGFETLEISKLMTLTNYRVNVRMVDQFRKGRVFVAGDAAHSHSPAGGQGMNSSIQDSYNLGWKLSLAIRSLASPSLLDSYSSERLPIIAGVLGKTTEMLEETVAPGAASNAKVWVRGPEIYQLNVHYRGSSIVFDELDSDKENVLRVRAGDRAPDAPGLDPITKQLGVGQLFDLFVPTRHIALIFPHDQSDIAPILSALAKYPKDVVEAVVILPKGSVQAEWASSWGNSTAVVDSKEYAWTAYPTTEGANVVIVRPDGYVGVVAKSVEGLEKYRRLVFNAAA